MSPEKRKFFRLTLSMSKFYACDVEQQILSNKKPTVQSGSSRSVVRATGHNASNAMQKD